MTAAEKPVTLSSADLDTAVKEILLGLTTDGAHHKQYALEKALRAICTDEWVDEAQREFQWALGVRS